MNITFPRGLIIDINNVPENFDEIIRNAFKDYTEYTAKEYQYQDKLSFIDRCAELLHKAEDEYDAVKAIILDNVEWELDEYGNLPDKDNFRSIDFMCECYVHGKKDMELYSHYTGGHHVDNKIMKLLERVIQIVINYED